MNAPDAPFVSVVTPTYDRRDRLDRVLRSLADQELDSSFEVVVVSDGSTDGTNDYLRSDDLPLPVVAVEQSNQGPATARNTGVEHARGDLIVFVDDDVVAEPGFLRAHVEAHERHGQNAVVVGPMLDPADHEMSPWVHWEQRMLEKQYEAMERGVYQATMRQFYTGNASIRREHVLAVGGFDPAFRRAEDVELAFRLDDHGLSFHFEPNAVGRHYADRPYESWRQTAYVYGRNDIIFAGAPGRDWLFDFIAEGFGRHHPAIRQLVRRSVRSARTRSGAVRVFERLLDTPLRNRPWVARYVLSGIYAIEYHQGVADELGSGEAFVDLVTTRGGR